MQHMHIHTHTIHMHARSHNIHASTRHTDTQKQSYELCFRAASENGIARCSERKHISMGTG